MRVINTALLSFGLSGKVFHAPFLNAHPGYRLAGSWERSKRSVESAYPGARSYGSMEDVLADTSIDLIIVNTPTDTHAAYAAKALQAGKHVVVEKAFTTNVREAESLISLAKAQRKTLAVYQNRRWDSDFLTVQHVLRQGKLGEVVEAQIAYERFNPTLSPKLHRETPGPGAGNLMDLGPHCIDEALVLFGMPQKVFADIRACRSGSLVDDYFDLLLYYPEMRVRLKSSYLVREQSPAFIVHGTTGSFIKKRCDVQAVQIMEGMRPDAPGYGTEPPADYGTIHTELEGKVVREAVVSQPGNYMGFYKQLFEAITEDGTVPVTGEEGMRVMKVIEAARESSQRNAVVELN